MAKPQEADPRWIVEERPDGINVNNWHWTEKNASLWSKTKLKELLENLVIEEPGLGRCEITSLTTIEGEAYANNRKAKLIFFYEWNLKGDWKGNLSGQTADEEVGGDFEIPNLSEENEPEEIELNINVTRGGGSAAGDAMKQLMRNKGRDLVREKLGQYINELKHDFARDLILPTKDGTAPPPVKNVIKHSGKSLINSNARVNSINKSTSESEKSQVSTSSKELELVEDIKCLANDLYQCLTVNERCTHFTRSSVDLNPTPGGKFSMFSGNVNGEFVSLEAPKHIKQKWRFDSWPPGHFSTVEFHIDQKESSTRFTIKQKGIPSDEFERTREGWIRNYIQPIKHIFGQGDLSDFCF